MSKLTIVEKTLADLQTKTEKMLKMKLEIVQNRRITCGSCNKTSRAKEWIFIQRMWYVEPYSCNGGDYWRPYEPETCCIACPKCKNQNYIYNHKQKPKILNLLKYGFLKSKVFKEIKEECVRNFRN